MYSFRIILRDIQLNARLGVFDWEREEMRIFPTTIEIDYRLSEPSIQKDDVDKVIDYAKLERFILSMAIGHEWKLLERLAHELADALLHNFALIDRVKVQVDKPQALDSMQSTAVIAERFRAVSPA